MLFFGINPLKEALRSKYSRRIREVIVEKANRSRRLEEILGKAAGLGISVREVDGKTLTKIVKTRSHQGVAFEVDGIVYVDIEYVAKKRENLVLCDSVQDPNNLGAISRSALLFDFRGVVVPKDRSVDITPSVAKASAGAIFHLDIVRVVNLARAIEFLKERGYLVIGLDVSGENDISRADFVFPVALVVGSEGEGMRRIIKEKCEIICRVRTTGSLDSLNVSVASAIAMYEVFKRRT